jgi:hypothetical protein
LFCAISDSTKLHDKIAFFVFFSFKSSLLVLTYAAWKRTLLADGPRAINAIILSALFQYVATYNPDNLVPPPGFHWSNVPILWGQDPGNNEHSRPCCSGP